MIRNYLKIALRNLLKNKAFSIINIAGLALGLTCCLLITMYVVDELSYDRFHKNADQIYRINADIKFGGQTYVLAVASDPLGHTLVKDYPQVKNAVRFRGQGSFLVKKGDENLKETRVIFADSTLFDVFTFPLIYGNPKTALAAPNTVVITESTARKYFNRTNVIGETLVFDDETNYKITGVMKDIPRNSHIQFDFFLAMAGLEESKQNNWMSHNFNTYLLLEKGADIKQLAAEMDKVVEQYVGPMAQQVMQITIDEFRKSGNYLNYTFLPLTDIHLHSNRTAELSPNSNIQYVYIFSAVALFVLLIACINFMNLATARSAGRAREVGIRKVMGSLKSSLIGQFLTESVIMALLSLVLAMLGVWLLLPWFNQLSGKEIALGAFTNAAIVPILLLFVIATGLLAGSYPAFFLSSFRPINVLKGRLSQHAKGGGFRSALVVFQFITSVLLIIGTIVIYRQLNYIQTKQLGFNKEQVLIINDAYALGDQLTAFKEEALRETGVVSGTISSFLPVPSSRNDSPIFPSPVPDQAKAVATQQWQVDHDYIKTMGMEISQGRDFSRDFLSDSTAVIINEAAALLLNFDNPVGQNIYNLQNINGRENEMDKYEVIGVVKNFHFESLRSNIAPVIFFLAPSKGNISFRLDGDDITGTVNRIQSKWRSMAAGQPFSYEFMDEAFDEVYRVEQRIGNIFISFATLAIFIACLGLFGLSAFMAEQRTKEIGIRKVLGASIGGIVTMLSKDFLRLVLIATVIAFPIAWWVMNKWLEDFAYRTSISWWIFALAGAVAVLIALATVSFQAMRAAATNPVESLRSE
ncbi:MAG: ABC transporter permease [Saprospiraceae bacterium]|nr:ABC transporter permease [Saprospiraceae bacterium]